MSRVLVDEFQQAKPGKALWGVFFSPVVYIPFPPHRERFIYNTGHFGAGNTVARRVIRAGVIPQLPSRDLFMKFIVWLICVLVFVLLLVLAFANTQPATLNFLAGYSWQAPLILIGLAFFVVGLLAGL